MSSDLRDDEESEGIALSVGSSPLPDSPGLHEGWYVPAQCEDLVT